MPKARKLSAVHLRRFAAIAFAASVTFASFPTVGRAAAPLAWEWRDNAWQPTQQTPAAPVTDATLDRAEQLINEKQNRSARKLLINWLKHHADSPVRDRGLFLMAQSWFDYGNRIKSFYYLDELLEKYPESKLFYPALQKQYEIGDAYLNGYNRRFLMLPLLGAEDEGIEVLYRVQQRSPGSSMAEKALLRTADYYYADSQFDLAADAYGSFARSFPRSPAVPRVRMRQAFASLAQYRGLKFDATPVIDARTQLAQVQNDYPQLAAEENIAAVLRRIDGAFAAKIYGVADFYRRTHEPKAAVYTYRFLLQTYPNSPEARRAKRDLEKMPAWALADPAPPAASGYAPSTEPVIGE
jgi:outer membrane assembly lipoprotein YfiO